MDKLALNDPNLYKLSASSHVVAANANDVFGLHCCRLVLQFSLCNIIPRISSMTLMLTGKLTLIMIIRR